MGCASSTASTGSTSLDQQRKPDHRPDADSSLEVEDAEDASDKTGESGVVLVDRHDSSYLYRHVKYVRSRLEDCNTSSPLQQQARQLRSEGSLLSSPLRSSGEQSPWRSTSNVSLGGSINGSFPMLTSPVTKSPISSHVVDDEDDDDTSDCFDSCPPIVSCENQLQQSSEAGFSPRFIRRSGSNVACRSRASILRLPTFAQSSDGENPAAATNGGVGSGSPSLLRSPDEVDTMEVSLLSEGSLNLPQFVENQSLTGSLLSPSGSFRLSQRGSVALCIDDVSINSDNHRRQLARPLKKEHQRIDFSL